MKFRKKPVVIEAVQFLGSAKFSETPDWLTNANLKTMAVFPDYVEIFTLEGTMSCNPNDWIIKGVHGELYPCKPDIFEKTYEQVKSEKPKEEKLWNYLKSKLSKLKDNNFTARKIFQYVQKA